MIDGNCLGAFHSKVLFLQVKRIWDFPSESFYHFSSESPLQTQDNVLAFQTRSSGAELQEHCVGHGVWKGKSCSSFSRKRHWKTEMIEIKEIKNVVLVCSSHPYPCHAFLGGLFSLANSNKGVPVFVRQHMLWLKMNSFNLLTMLDCSWSGLLFHSIEVLNFISYKSSVLVSSAASWRGFFMVSKEPCKVNKG